LAENDGITGYNITGAKKITTSITATHAAPSILVMRPPFVVESILIPKSFKLSQWAPSNSKYWPRTMALHDKLILQEQNKLGIVSMTTWAALTPTHFCNLGNFPFSNSE
jgi:hypothetical protein